MQYVVLIYRDESKDGEVDWDQLGKDYDAYAAAVWMDMTLRLAKWKATLLNSFWSPQKAVLIHMGPPHVATYRELIAPTNNAEHVADLCGAPWSDEQTARRALGPQLDALVARSDLSLASFLDSLG